jgi:predicted ATP-grasp superfamily ATP-dependent carboligase
MADAPAVLIAAISGRALAASARRGGYLPLVADFFGDQDTLEVAHAHARLAGSLTRGIDGNALVHALATLSAGREPIGVVCGTGFEDRTQVLQRLGERWRLFGNSAETIAKIKDPEFLSALCADLDIPVPKVSSSKPENPSDWLAKRKGGAGGTHIKPAARAASRPGDTYYQQKLPGAPMSALFLADGGDAALIGFSAQWSLPTRRHPYRYGGAVRPAEFVPPTANALAAVVHRLAKAMSLVGLNSADFLVDGERFWLLEVNPRPGATFDVFEPPQGSLFALHMAACTGQLGEAPLYPDGAKAAAIVYAEDDIRSVPARDWPDWTADRPIAGSAINSGEPVCTVYACSSTAAGARTLADERRELVLAWTRARKI